MEKVNNYLIQARQAKDRFLTYDQQALIAKLKLRFDEAYLYVPMLAETYRIHRKTGDMERNRKGTWIDANSFGEVMVLLDLLCDSRPDRWVRGRWKDLSAFGLMFHRNLLENPRDPLAEQFQEDPRLLHRACQAMEGTPLPNGDICYCLELFDGLPVAVQLWFGDEEFPANLRFLWDENSLMYIKYETMHFARGLLRKRLEEDMG